jgi:hypothetical protein
MASNPMRLARTLIAICLFGIAFGYVEAAVVVYLRTIDEPVRQALFCDVPHDAVFPLLTLEQLQAADHVYVVQTELGRELATLVMLAAIGWLTGRTFREWLAGFVIAFGVWDIFYYVFLKMLIDWPASLWTWDILFLLPVPWVGPVIAPVVISLTMIYAGTLTLWRESLGRPVICHCWNGVIIGVGGLAILGAFCWDFRNTAAGGWPNSFNWPLFVLGEAIVVAGIWRAGGPKRQL